MTGSYKIIQSLARAFSIIDCFTKDTKELSLNDISESLHLNINTTRGLVQTLLHFNYLSFDENERLYRLGSVFLDKAEIARHDYTEKILLAISGDLQRVADKYSVSTRFHSVENVNITTLMKKRPSRSRYILSVHNQTEFPLNASASGKLILAHLDEKQKALELEKIRWEKFGNQTILAREELEEQLIEIIERDVSIEEDELGDGYSSMAIPVFKDEQLVFTISVFSTTQLIKESFEDLLNELRNVRENIYRL